jgi:hypothetical protein
MSLATQTRLLMITRWLIYFMMGVMAIAAVALLITSIVMPAYWQEIVAKLAQKYPKFQPEGLATNAYAMILLAMLILALIWMMLKRLLAIIASAELGDPFNFANSARLKAIGWLMVAVQIVGIPLAIAAGRTVDKLDKNNVSYDFSLNAILAILLVFSLAGIFEQGARMREELEGTV